MADLQEFNVTPGEAAQINVPTHTITAKVYDNNQHIIANYTGSNAIVWPNVLAEFSQEQVDNIINDLATQIVLMRAGLA